MSGIGRSARGSETVPAAQLAIQARCRHPSGVFEPMPPDVGEGSIQRRFEEIVRRYPRRIAVVAGARRVTYRELDQWASRIASRILDGGDRVEACERPVAVMAAPGPEHVASVLGALKAGRFYVAVDPSYPTERRAFLLEDSQATVVLTCPASEPIAGASVRPGQSVVDVAALERIAPGRAGEPARAASADSLACIVYTSGSTGTPKGVLLRHRNVLHEVAVFTNCLGFSREDRVAGAGSPSFIGAARDTFGALLNGATLYPFDLKRHGIAALRPWLSKRRITVLRCVASTFRELLRGPIEDGAFDSLRVVMLTGEPAYRSDFEAYRAHLPAGCILVSRMGSTESMCFRWLFSDKDSCITSSRLPAGYALDGWTVTLADERGEAVAEGEPGEILVRSRYLSPGYWNDPDLTARRFSPADAVLGERVFRSGDIGVRRPDGCLEVLGRRDHQLKVRGFRVHPGEVESALMALPEVEDAVVVAADAAHDGLRLVAYVVLGDGERTDPAALRSSLGLSLPDFMLPASFVLVPSLPRTPHGKVDRAALPDVPSERPPLESAYLAPRSPLEHRLAVIWSETLGIEAPGVRDHFADLGGDSLLASRVFARVVETFGIGQAEILESVTIEAMASAIEAALLGGEGAAERVAEILADLGVNGPGEGSPR